ncbi:MAG: hypothetical protein WA419_13995 [Silvibacterium sp.]
MKRITTIALFAIASVLGPGKALAQGHAVKVTVPFNFTVGKNLLPPGIYKILPVTDNVIEIRNQDSQVSILSQISPDSNLSKNGGELVFDKYDGQYFLREILVESAALSVNLPPTKAEQRARRQEAMLPNHIQLVLAAN